MLLLSAHAHAQRADSTPDVIWETSHSSSAAAGGATTAERVRPNIDIATWPTAARVTGLGQDASAPAARRDSVLNGVLIGAGVGALVGLIPDHYDDCEECHDSLYASIGVGAGVGLLVDLLRGKSPPASPSGRQTSLFLGVGSPRALVRFGGAVRWR